MSTDDNNPKPLHVPTEEEMRALLDKATAQYYRIKSATLIYDKFVKLASPAVMGEKRYNKVLGWLAARVLHLKENLEKTNNTLSEGARLRMLRDQGDLN